MALQANIKKNSKSLYYWPIIRGIHRWLVDYSQKSPAMWKAFPSQDLIMPNKWHCQSIGSYITAKEESWQIASFPCRDMEMYLLFPKNIYACKRWSSMTRLETIVPYTWNQMIRMLKIIIIYLYNQVNDIWGYQNHSWPIKTNTAGHICNQCWKFPPVRRPEADNFSIGPATHLTRRSCWPATFLNHQNKNTEVYISQIHE